MKTTKEYTLDAVELLKKMIKTPSVSRDESDVADVFSAQLEKWGIEYERHGNNLLCKCANFSDSKPTILLNGHIDTVKVVSGWTKDPFGAEETDGMIYGLGSNDDGGGVVALLQAFRALSKTEQSYNLVYLASCEEEVSGKNGIESVLPLLPKIDFALVGEPTGMQPAIAEKGLMVLDVTSYGKSGHAARNEGVNAIYKAIDDIMWFKSHQFERQTELLGPVKMSVTIINAGTQHNVVPDRCVFTVDVRSNECYSNMELFEKIQKNVKSEVKARSFRLNSSRINPDHPFILKAKDVAKEEGYELCPFGSPTLSDQALMSFPSLKMGPGQSSRSHTADEFIGINEIEFAISTYIKILDGLCL